MVSIPAGKFWMGRTFFMILETMGVLARDRMDTIPANHVYLDAFDMDRYEVIPQRCGYWPVEMATRDGEQIGELT